MLLTVAEIAYLWPVPLSHSVQHGASQNLIPDIGALLRGPRGPWPHQNFGGGGGQNAFGPTNNWPEHSLVLALLIDADTGIKSSA